MASRTPAHRKPVASPPLHGDAMTTTDTHHVRHGDLITLADDYGAMTTYRFVDQLKPVRSDQGARDTPSDLYEGLTAGSAIGMRLLVAQLGDALTVTHLDRTFPVHFVAHQPTPQGATDGPHT